MKWIYLLMMVGLCFSCYEDEKITPRTPGEEYFQLPQGNHDYDAKIVDYNKKYGFYILYDFAPEDVYWTSTNWDEYLGSGNLSDRDNIGDKLFVSPGDPEYAGKLLSLCESVFFKCYPEELLQQMLLEFYLCSDLRELSQVYDPVIYNYRMDSARIHVYRNFHCLAVNGASVEIDTMSRKLKMELQRKLNTEFLAYLDEQGNFEISKEFTEVCDYKYQYLRGEALFEKGYLNGETLIMNQVETSQKNDFSAYMELITMPLEVLEGEPVPIGSDVTSRQRPPLEGCLNPKRDKKGLVRKKYDILVQYFHDKYGIDTGRLQHPDL